MFLIVVSTVSNTRVGTFSFTSYFIRKILIQNIFFRGIICSSYHEEFLNGEWLWPLNNIISILQDPIYTFDWFEYNIYILKFEGKYCRQSDSYGGMNWKTTLPSPRICRWIRYSLYIYIHNIYIYIHKWIRYSH